MQRMHADFRYESQSTQINTPALQALALRTGVCQDFAHIMLRLPAQPGPAGRATSAATC
jgi:transglutaminase-like putative cysteine protease